MSIISWFKSLFSKAISVLNKVLKVAWPPAKKALKGLLINTAIYVCQELAKSDLTNDDKRKEAIKRIKNYAISSSITVGENVIRSTIEDAVAYLKTKGDIQ